MGEDQGIALECPLKYAFYDPDGQKESEGKATARLSGENLALLPSMGHALLFGLREITTTNASDHKLEISLSSGEKLVLFHMGLRYDDFCRELRRLCNQLTLRDLLMDENLLMPGQKSKYRHDHGDGENSGQCEIRLYETALVVIPESAPLTRVPLSYISAVEVGDHILAVDVEDGGRFTFSHLGPRLDLVQRSLSGAMNELALQTQHLLQELAPGASPAVIRRAARLLRDGRAASRSDLESRCPGLWSGLEARLVSAGLDGKYGFLKALSQRERIAIGFKRGLLGDATGEYLWFLIPIYSTDPGQPGNAVAVETVSSTGGNRATYFFRLTGRDLYARGLTQEDLDRRAVELTRTLNRCLLEINFRREPIYLPEERLLEPRYARYRVAVDSIPGLKTLRDRFIGRVIHSSPEQWQRDVMDLLEFNISTLDDSRKWRKQDDLDVPEGLPERGDRDRDLS